MAPGLASLRGPLIGLKVLDYRGAGYISDVIAALDWAVENKAAHNIRVVNLGQAADRVYWTDPHALRRRSSTRAS
jgi:hypothetical protein